jgi:hypothetical protein
VCGVVFVAAFAGGVGIVVDDGARLSEGAACEVDSRSVPRSLASRSPREDLLSDEFLRINGIATIVSQLTFDTVLRR